MTTTLLNHTSKPRHRRLLAPAVLAVAMMQLGALTLTSSQASAA